MLSLADSYAVYFSVRIDFVCLITCIFRRGHVYSSVSVRSDLGSTNFFQVELLFLREVMYLY